MNFFDHKGLGNHLLQLCPKVVKHPVYIVCVFVFVALSIQHVTRMRHILICSRAFCTIFFHILSPTARFFLKIKELIEYTMRFLLQLSSETFLIQRRNEQDMIHKIYIGLRVKCLILSSDFNETWIFSIFSKNTQISIFMQIRPVGAELFHADGRTGMTKLIAAFRNFAKAPKKINKTGKARTT